MPSKPSFDLSGTRAFVTGAGRGLGRGIACSLAEWGATVCAGDIGETDLAETRDLLKARDVPSFAQVFDVTDESAVETAVDAAWRDMGGIDLLVNNAGVISVSAVVDMTLAEWRRVLDVNATGTFLVSRAVARRMIDARIAGSFVSIASIAGKIGDLNLAHYSASKFAVVGFTQALAKELAASGITVNAVCPGVVETQMIDLLARGWAGGAEEMTDGQAVKRPQTAREISSAIAFLHQNRAMTGQAINVDGGTVFH